MNNFFFGELAILILMALGTAYFSRFYLRHEKFLTEEDLIKINPNYNGIYKKYHRLYNSWLGFYFVAGFLIAIVFFSIPFFLTAIGIYLRLGFNGLILIPAASVTIAIIDGLFIINTGVVPASGNHTFDRFVYNKNINYLWIAVVQIVFGIVIIGISLVIFFMGI